MIGRPEANETAPYYFTYINQIPSDNILAELETQSEGMLVFLSGISDEQSLHRYAPEKWSIRQVLSHINDTERAFVFRALWFARGFDSPLPGFDQNIAIAAAGAEEISWARHVEEFRGIRMATLSLFRNMPPEGWTRTGVASGYPFTVRSLAYIIAGHAAHHAAILRDRYM